MIPYQLLRQALLNRQSCFCIYDGLERYFCPHVIGWKHGVEQVLVWQYGGLTSRGPITPTGQWKCLTIANMQQLATTSQPWHVGEPGRTGRPTSCVDQVDQQILL
jgi:hypothetical protein